MQVHILNKVWEEKLDDWDINTLPYRGTQVSIKLCKGCGADMDSQVDINSCTDACTCSKQGVGTEMRWLGHKHTAIQGHSTWHQSMHRGCTRWGQSGGHKFMYWCMYTFETRCGKRNEMTGNQTHCHTGASRFPSNYAWDLGQTWAVRCT